MEYEGAVWGRWKGISPETKEKMARWKFERMSVQEKPAIVAREVDRRYIKIKNVKLRITKEETGLKGMRNHLKSLESKLSDLEREMSEGQAVWDPSYARDCLDGYRERVRARKGQRKGHQDGE